MIELTDNLYGETNSSLEQKRQDITIIDATYDIQNNQYFENRTVTVIAEEGYHIFVAARRCRLGLNFQKSHPRRWRSKW